MSESLIVVSNFLLAFATIALAFVTLLDVHKEDQRTLRELMGLPILRRKKGQGRHE